MNLYELTASLETQKIREAELLPRALGGDTFAKTCIIDCWTKMSELEDAIKTAKKIADRAPATRPWAFEN